MPTAKIVRRGKRRSSVRVTLAMRRRKIIAYSGRWSSGQTSTLRNSNDEKPVRKNVRLLGSCTIGPLPMKKKYSQMNEIAQSPKPLHQIRVEFNQEEMDKIIGTVRSISGETKIPHLLDVLVNQGFERNIAEDKVQQLVDARKIIIDNEGYICWTYNPVLAAHYRSHPELRIR